jgi:hypothetical protein
MARNNLVDLLWHVAPIEDAAREACELIDELRARPSAYADMDLAFANLIGILSECGRLDEARAAAREALEAMRRTRMHFIEEWAYLFWRLGRVETAAVLLGASDAEMRRTELPLLSNEARLVTAVRTGVESSLDPATLAHRLAAGAALGESELVRFISEALAQP